MLAIRREMRGGDIMDVWGTGRYFLRGEDRGEKTTKDRWLGSNAAMRNYKKALSLRRRSSSHPRLSSA